MPWTETECTFLKTSNVVLLRAVNVVMQEEERESVCECAFHASECTNYN